MIEEEEWSKELEANRKPGQKHPTPSPGFPDRVFYESLLQQRPDSRMAQKWCLEHGVLKWAEAEALCKKMGISSVRTRSRVAASSLCPANLFSSFLPTVVQQTKSVKVKREKATTSRTGSRKVVDEAATAEAMEISTSGFEAVGLGAL
ncbi:hypothetical protein PsorP6_007358 [Peronosclerospora sorghi]|uniref:Uncharacterized protein n=1 Tax=Peronosclerospora sorghi TaxID=230839 RepID=A0ACC0W7N3_9STRA|nr:hypothetical protein PsorP6_007358 [Peronosclerospora sorghi]